VQVAAKYRPKLARLSFDAVDVTASDFDWFDEETRERWEYVYPDLTDLGLKELRAIADATSEEARKALDAECHDFDPVDGACDFCLADSREECEEEQEGPAAEALATWFQENPDEADLDPQMNYAYPLPGGADPGSLQAELIEHHLPLCVVELDGEPVMALTGGGMDLSWEICRAYMVAGFMPPYHWAKRLPAMAGDFAEWKPGVLVHALESCKCIEQRGARAVQYLRELADAEGVELGLGVEE